MNFEVENDTPFPHAVVPFKWPDDVERQTVVVKATFQIVGTECVVADDQRPILFADVMDDKNAEVKFAADSAPFKPKSDVVLVGRAVSPNEKPVKQMRVRLSIGKLEKTLLVTGDRQWKIPPWFVGWVQTSPKPFTRMELSYTRSFGGIDETKPGFCAENPVGVGYLAKRSKREIADSVIPNIEYADNQIDSPFDKIKPGGFGFIHPSWQPRTNFLGTYDEEWERTRKPLLARDFSMNYYNAAPLDQQVSPYLKGGENVELEGCSAIGTIRFILPKLALIAKLIKQDGVVVQTSLNLDTVCFMPDDNQFYLVWRCVIGSPQEIVGGKLIIL